MSQDSFSSAQFEYKTIINASTNWIVCVPYPTIAYPSLNIPGKRKGIPTLLQFYIQRLSPTGTCSILTTIDPVDVVLNYLLNNANPAPLSIGWPHGNFSGVEIQEACIAPTAFRILVNNGTYAVSVRGTSYN